MPRLLISQRGGWMPPLRERAGDRPTWRYQKRLLPRRLPTGTKMVAHACRLYSKTNLFSRERSQASRLDSQSGLHQSGPSASTLAPNPVHLPVGTAIPAFCMMMTSSMRCIAPDQGLRRGAGTAVCQSAARAARAAGAVSPRYRSRG